MDEDSAEEHLIELLLDLIGRGSVGEGTIDGEIERHPELGLNIVESRIGRLQLAAYLKQGVRDAFLFLLEEIHWDGALVVRFHELLALSLEFVALEAEAVEFLFRVRLRTPEFVEQKGLDTVSQPGIELDLTVVVRDLLLDLFN